MQRFIKVAEHMTANRFGCDQDYFDHNIKNKPLRVTAATANLVFVVDSEDEAWSVSKGDFEECESTHPATIL